MVAAHRALLLRSLRHDNAEAFEYLTDLECPLEHNSRSACRGEALDWLLRHAVSLEHADSCCASDDAVDSAEARGAIAGLLARLDLAPAAAGSGNPDTGPGRPAAGPGGAGAALPELAGALGRAAEHIAARLRAPAAGDNSNGTAMNGVAEGAAFDVGAYPLGFATGEAALDTAATVLRLLYLRDLRTLQTQIDEALVRVQEFTANPRTNSQLGRVGR